MVGTNSFVTTGDSTILTTIRLARIDVYRGRSLASYTHRIDLKSRRYSTQERFIELAFVDLPSQVVELRRQNTHKTWNQWADSVNRECEEQSVNPALKLDLSYCDTYMSRN